jgi:HlyD family secretion protein
MSERSTLIHGLVRRLLSLCLVFAVLSLFGCGGKEVQVVSPKRGEIRESFSEPARTRLAKSYPVTMPVQGRIRRIDLEPGDKVTKGEELVSFDRVPLEKAVEAAKAKVAALKAEMAVKKDNNLEHTALVETRATIKAAVQALNASDEQVAAEKARYARADKELRRMSVLKAGKAIAQTKLDDVTLRAETSLLELRRQQFYRAALNALLVAIRLGPLYVERYMDRKGLEETVIERKLEEAVANLGSTEHQLKLARILSPIDGVVLNRYEQGDSALPPGKPLLLLGNLTDMEVVADVMTQDALRLKPGSRVKLRPAAGLGTINGRVKRIEPAGFTKLSSLGVEQQRVRVIVSLDRQDHKLGVGYRLQAEFFTGFKPNALIVPRFSVMQAPDRTMYVFKVIDGRLMKQPVTIGLRNDLDLEVLKGLTDKDVIVARPDATLREAMRVTPRS